MFPGVDFSLCVVLGSTGSGVPMIEGSRCIYPVGEQGAQVIVEFYNWAQDQFPIDVDYWESYASLAGTWSWGQYLQVTANGQQAIYWTYDDHASRVMHCDPARIMARTGDSPTGRMGRTVTS
jgi:hypothetical protein